MTRVLMIGFNKGFLTALDRCFPAATVAVVEEPDVFRARALDQTLSDIRCVAKPLLAPYQQSDGLLEPVLRAHEETPFDAVVPGLEYAVPAAAAVADRLSLRGATEPAAAALRDKLLLRKLTSAAGVLNPEWREISGPSEIATFAAQRRSVVVKPANRRGSVGVYLLDDPRDAQPAWDQVVGADEGSRLASRAMQWRYLVEARLLGDEYSVEALVQNSEIRFQSITAKVVSPGPHPVEIGHVVPAPLDRRAQESFASVMQLLVAATGFANGVLHAEWMLTAQGPALIECAGRPPGDSIFDLVERAYGVNLYVALIDLLAGRDVDLPLQPKKGAAIRFLVASPGPVHSIRGAEEVRADPMLPEVVLNVSKGTDVAPLRSSWDRCGHVLVEASTGEEAAAAATRLAEKIVIETARR